MNFWGGIEHSSTSVILEFFIARSDTGQGMTGLSHTSSGLVITHSYDNAFGASDSSAATSSIETVTTLHTFSTPTAGFVRFREVSASTKPGSYQVQFEDSVFSATDAKDLFVNIFGVTDMLDMAYRISLDVVTLADISAELTSYGVPTVTQMNARTLPSEEFATALSQSSLSDSVNDLSGRTPVALSAGGKMECSIEEVEGQDIRKFASGGQKYGV